MWSAAHHSDMVKPILEVHLLDFDQQIYGRRISVNLFIKLEMSSNSLI